MVVDGNRTSNESVAFHSNWVESMRDDGALIPTDADDDDDDDDATLMVVDEEDNVAAVAAATDAV